MSTSRPRNVGELRPTQMMFTYGVGAIVDLPYLSVIVMGLDDWSVDPGVAREIHEERLLRVVRWELGSQVQKLLSPPALQETTGLPNPFDEPARVGVPVASFPRWMLCPKCRLLAPLGSGLFELKHDPYHPDRSRYVHITCTKAKKPPTVVPARFMVACENGHLDDFPWVEFVHEGPTNCAAILRLFEFSPTGEARDLYVRCDECDRSRPLSYAFGDSGKKTMPTCRGRRPHLRDYDDQDCDLQVRAILLGASNLWFPDVLITMAIPAESTRLAQMVADHWATLKHFPDVASVTLLRTIGQLGAFHGYTDDDVWRAIQEKREQEDTDQGPDPLDLKGPEWELFTHPDASFNTEDFRLREVGVPADFQAVLERVVLVERLREVRALVGFTRIDAPGEFGESPDAAAGQRMSLSRRPPAWVPAAEVRGEGIFVQFKESQIRSWLARAAVHERDAEFLESHRRWRQARFIEPPEANYPGLRYLLLHSFACFCQVKTGPLDNRKEGHFGHLA